MKCMAEMNGLVFLKVAAYAALSGKDFSNKARFYLELRRIIVSHMLPAAALQT